MPELTEVIGPSYWASYFVNGDDSSLSSREVRMADRWLKREGVRVISTKDDEEPWFTNSYDLYAPETGFRGGDVITYVCEVL